jgi:hypothetical protein
MFVVGLMLLIVRTYSVDPVEEEWDKCATTYSEPYENTHEVYGFCCRTVPGSLTLDVCYSVVTSKTCTLLEHPE